MAAPKELETAGLKHMEDAFAAVRAEQSAGAAEVTARQAKHRATYMIMICVGVADAVRQLIYKGAKKRMEQSEPQDGDEVIMRNYKSVAAYNAYVHNTLQVDVNSDDRISDTKFKKYVKYFWLFGHKYGPLEFNNVTIDHAALDRDQWTESVQNSPYAEERTLLFVLADGFGDALLARLPTNSWDKSLNLLIQEVDATVKKVDAPAKAPARRRKKAAPTPAETTSENELDEEATEKAPKAKAAARRARKKATEPVETTTTTATTPTNDGLITALKERVSSLERELDAHKTTFEVREANSKSKISTLESKLESSQAELAACREALTERDEQLADKDETIDGFEFANETLSTSLESLKNQLAVAENALIEEKAKNKTPSMGRPQTSPLRDATNA